MAIPSLKLNPEPAPPLLKVQSVTLPIVPAVNWAALAAISADSNPALGMVTSAACAIPASSTPAATKGNARRFTILPIPIIIILQITERISSEAIDCCPYPHCSLHHNTMGPAKSMVRNDNRISDNATGQTRMWLDVACPDVRRDMFLLTARPSRYALRRASCEQATPACRPVTTCRHIHDNSPTYRLNDRTPHGADPVVLVVVSAVIAAVANLRGVE